jgi:hypothetical protein
MGFADQFGKFLMGDWKGIGKGSQNEGSFQFDNWGDGLIQLAKQLVGWTALAEGGTEGMGALGSLLSGGGGAGGSSSLSSGLSSLWDKAGSGLSGLWDKFGSGTGQTPLTGEETSFLSGLGDMSGWEESGSGGGMSISKLSDMLKGMGGQQKQSGGGNQSLEPLYRLLEATKQGQNVPPAPIQPLPPMRSMF